MFSHLTVVLLCVSVLSGLNPKEGRSEERLTDFGQIFTSIDTLAFTFGNVWVLGDSVINTPAWFRSGFYQLNDLMKRIFHVQIAHVMRTLVCGHTYYCFIVCLVCLRVSDFLMGDVDSSSRSELFQTRRSRVSSSRNVKCCCTLVPSAVWSMCLH